LQKIKTLASQGLVFASCFNTKVHNGY
jgi:hypothetical protein